MTAEREARRKSMVALAFQVFEDEPTTHCLPLISFS